MKNLTLTLRIAKYALVAAALVFAYFYITDSFRKEISRLENNLIESFNTSGTKMFKLTEEEFKDYVNKENNKLLSVLMDSLNIKPNKIIRTVNNKYYYNYGDTIIQATQVSDSVYKTEYVPDSCVSIQVSFDTGKEAFIFGDLIFDYESQSVLFKRRETKNGRKIFWPFGKVKLILKTINKCTGDTMVQEIEIVKQ